MDPALRASLVAGVLAGLAGLVAFTLLHVLLVGPLWVLLAVGLLPAVFAGIWVGWGHHELREAGKLPARPLEGAAYGALLWLTLVPLEVLAFVRGPAAMGAMEAMRRLGPEVLLPALGGALLGWLLTRHARRALALGLAALFLALPVAGTLVALGATPRGPLLFLGLLGVYVVAGLVLAEARPHLPGARGPPSA